MEVLTLKETMGYLKISRSAIYTLINSGKLQSYKFGGSLRFDKSDIMRFIERSKVKI